MATVRCSATQGHGVSLPPEPHSAITFPSNHLPNPQPSNPFRPFPLPQPSNLTPAPSLPNISSRLIHSPSAVQLGLGPSRTPTYLPQMTADQSSPHLPDWLETGSAQSPSPGAPEDDPDTPACPRCLTPFAPDDRYCSSCGFCVGQFTPFLPVEGIRFGADLYRSAWATADGRSDRRSGLRLLSICYLLFAAPIITAIGVVLRVLRPSTKPSVPPLTPTDERRA